MERNILGDTEELTIKTDASMAKLTLLGGHIISFIPSDGLELFWLGGNNSFTEGKAIRGGIPICWPRFGDEQLNGVFPKHGFARNQSWALNALEESNDKVVVSLSMQQAALYKEQQTITALLNLKITITDSIEVELDTLNIGEEPLSYSEALHSYFSVGDINTISILGLEGHHYLDKIDHAKDKVENGVITFKSETDRIFYNHLGSIQVIDPIFKRTIIIEKSGSNSTIIWNPYQKTIGDEVVDSDYKNFVCVEPGNVSSNYCTIAPGERNKLSMKISVFPL